MSSTDTIATTASDPTAVVATAQFLTPVVLGLQALTINAKQAHWHVRGANFMGVHEFLDQVVTHAQDAGDPMCTRSVVVAHPALGRWLQERIADRCGRHCGSGHLPAGLYLRIDAPLSGLRQSDRQFPAGRQCFHYQ